MSAALLFLAFLLVLALAVTLYDQLTVGREHAKWKEHTRLLQARDELRMLVLDHKLSSDSEAYTRVTTALGSLADEQEEIHTVDLVRFFEAAHLVDHEGNQNFIREIRETEPEVQQAFSEALETFAFTLFTTSDTVRVMVLLSSIPLLKLTGNWMLRQVGHWWPPRGAAVRYYQQFDSEAHRLSHRDGGFHAAAA